jgi:hypothetical protein
MGSQNKFLKFQNGISSNSSSTFVIDSGVKILSVEVKITDTVINVPNANQSEYDIIQYRKTVDTLRDVIFLYEGNNKGKIYHHRHQNLVFHKFKTLNGSLTWIL